MSVSRYGVYLNISQYEDVRVYIYTPPSVSRGGPCCCCLGRRGGGGGGGETTRREEEKEEGGEGKEDDARCSSTEEDNGAGTDPNQHDTTGHYKSLALSIAY